LTGSAATDGGAALGSPDAAGGALAALDGEPPVPDEHAATASAMTTRRLNRCFDRMRLLLLNDDLGSENRISPSHLLPASPM
jgi:hypothetical protein